MTTKIKDPIAARIQEIAGFAARSFKQHQVTVRLDHGLFRSWRCAIPERCQYAFNVTTEPGRIFVTGDIGVLVVERCEDMLAWCRGSIDSISYFASKVPHEIPTRAYDGEVAEAWILEVINDPETSQAHKKELQEILDDIGTESEHAIIDAVYESGVVDGCDFPDFTNYKSSFLWCREAIKFLLSKIDAPKE